MLVRSLGYRSDLMFSRFGGQIVDAGEYLVIRTPSNPTYRWGNYLLFARPPAPGDEERWPELFEREMPHLEGRSDQRTFGWDAADGSEGHLGPFLERGYRADRSVVLTAQSVHLPPRPSEDAEVRPLRSDEDWARATRNQILCREEREEEAGYRVFKERQMHSYREMASAGLGEWFGAFVDAELVADLGLFVEDGVARFQQVCTAPDRRRRGFCGTLVHGAASFGLEQLGAKTLVLVADAGGPAARIYGSVGFEATERMIGIEQAK